MKPPTLPPPPKGFDETEVPTIMLDAEAKLEVWQRLMWLKLQRGQGVVRSIRRPR